LFKNVEETPPLNSEEGVETQSRFFRLLWVGFVLIFVGIIIVVFASLLYGNFSSGGVIFIGPFPIVFGVGLDAPWLIVISLVLAILTLAAFWVMSRRIRRQSA
jgi:uncharacterized membrane protein